MALAFVSRQAGQQRAFVFGGQGLAAEEEQHQGGSRSQGERGGRLAQGPGERLEGVDPGWTCGLQSD
jgi:hypothetical protein